MLRSKSDNDDDEVVIAVAVAELAVAEPARVRVPKLSKELLAVVTPLCQAHAQQHGKEFGAAVNDLIQWAITEAPKINMTWEDYIRAYVAHLEAEEEASRNQNNLLPTPLKNYQETTTFKVETSSSSCSNAAAHDNKTLELLISRLEKVAVSIESNRDAEISTLKRSFEEAREHFEKETTSLRKEISDQKKELDELLAWDTVNITWKIPNRRFSDTFSSKTNVAQSSTFNVAHYYMKMGITLAGNPQYGYLGFFITHLEGDWIPIQIGGSSVSVVGNENKDTKTLVFDADAVIKKAESSAGWEEFVARKDLEKKFVCNGVLTLKARIRVRRPTNANLNMNNT